MAPIRINPATLPACCAVLALLACVAGCMTPARALRETERTGNRLAADYRRQVTGVTNAFTVLRPSDRLRARLMLTQGLPGTVDGAPPAVSAAALPDPLVLTLTEALAAGARNDSGYQDMKEAVFQAALKLDLQRHGFENNFAGILSGGIKRSEGEDGVASSQAQGGVKSSVTRTLTGGATLAASLGLDVIRLLTGEGGSTLGLLGDATIAIPLLRGSGRAVVREPLTQAERDLVYAIYDFESYRQSYAVRVADAYYGLLEAGQQVTALRDNQKRLSDSYRRAEMLSAAGRMSKVELDQTRQDLLRTGDQLVGAVQTRESRLDQFKITLGLPADAHVDVAMAELTRLESSMGLDAKGTNLVSVAAPALPWSDAQAVELALTNRFDLVVARARLEDAARATRLAADALRPDMALAGSASHGRTRVSGGGQDGDKSDYGLTLEAGLPWERTAERNGYRAALIAMDAAARAVEAAEDGAKQAVRSGLRSLRAAWSSFGIQSEAVRVAMRRVHSTDLFQQAGRADVRDVLDAESALLAARNALVSAVVRYRMAGLELRRDLSLLTISEEGWWREPDAENP